MDGSAFSHLPVGKLIGFAIFGFIVAVLGGIGGAGWLIWLAIEHLRIV